MTAAIGSFFFFFFLSTRFGKLSGAVAAMMVVATTTTTAAAAAATAVRMQMGPVTPAVINKAGFVGVLSPAATRRDEGGILSPRPSRAPARAARGRQTIKRSLCEASGEA